MAQVLSRGRAGRDSFKCARLAWRFHQDKRRKISRSDRLRQHGQDDVLRRTGPEVAHLRQLPYERCTPASGRTHRADDAERTAVPDRRFWRAARGLRRRQLQPVVLAARTQASAPPIPVPRRSSSWRTSPPRSKKRLPALRSEWSSSPAPATNWAAPKGSSSIRSCATSGAPCPRSGYRRRCVSIARSPWDRAAFHGCADLAG